jgi:hypothetical protein
MAGIGGGPVFPVQLYSDLLGLLEIAIRYLRDQGFIKR